MSEKLFEINFTAPKPPEKLWKNKEDLTKEKLDAYKVSIDSYNNEYKLYLKQRHDYMIKVVSFLKENGFPSSYRVSVKSRSRYPKFKDVTLMEEFNKFVPIVASSILSTYYEEEELKKRDSDKRKGDLDKAASEVRDKAIKWLLNRNKVYGTDFTADNAISVAKELAYSEKVEKLIKELKDGDIYTSFEGQNCEGPCLGWDGESRRCDCGNRRVSWTYDSWSEFSLDDDSLPYVYAEAY